MASGRVRKMNASRRAFSKDMIALSGILTLGGCSILFPTWTYRYRLTVEVERDGKLQSGSSVIEVQREKGFTGIGGTFCGEAVVVDLGEAGLLFALLNGPYGGGSWPLFMPHHALASLLGTEDMVDEAVLDRLTRMDGVSAVLSAEDYPTFAHFRDINDPKSIEEVNPLDLAATFGAMTRLREVRMEMTRDPIAHDMYKIIPWIKSINGGYLDGANVGSAANNGMHGGYFTTGFKK